MATKIYHLLMKSVFLLYFLCLWTSPHAAERDSLKPGDTLNSSSSLVSASRRFALRFSQLGNDKSTNVNNLLLGISDCASELIVWHAGKSNVARNSSVLTLDNEGTLKVITRKGGVPIVLYNSSTQPTNNTIATLLDSGNFILKELQSNGSTKRLLWQSFDHPRDTFLPEMKLGVNHKTGKTWSLTSRLADYIPSPGAFSLEWDPKGRELIIRRRGVIYWKSGNRFQNLLPDATSIYEFKVISNGEEEYFSFRDKNQSQQSEWILATTGQLKVIEGPIIARADICYGYNTNGGCQKWKQPKCRDGEELDFSSGYFIKNEDHSTKIANASLSISDCRADCWNNCSCVAYSSLSDNATGCQFWTEMLWFIPGYSRDLFVLKPKTSESRSDSGTKNWRWISIAIVAAVIVVFFCMFCYLLRRRKLVLREKKKFEDEKEILALVRLNTSTNDIEIPNDGKNGHDFNIISYTSVMSATNNFSLENKLGEGGFGPVYKGKLPTGQKIAVKRLGRNSRQGILEFKNELILISKLQHMNLVELIGCCIHGEDMMLIYEYMHNKSLDYFLFDSNRSKLLDWKKRFNIIEGIAQGLLYLHKYSRLKVIHRDLKASNILLDKNMNPKISDFGMARIFNPHELEENTNRIVGTYGYMSPEYVTEGIFSIKSDVYSFGVLMLEIVSGRKNKNLYRTDHVLNLVGHACDLWQEVQGLELVDPTIRGSCVNYTVLRCIHIGLLCTEISAIDRPTMLDVLSMLTSESTQLPLPKKPAFTFGVNGVVGENILDKEPNVHSVNNSTSSIMCGR